MKIAEKVKEIEAITTNIKDFVIAKIQALPDNPRIKRMGKGCFVVQSSDLNYQRLGKTQSNWSPEFHDFRIQYDLICNVIRKSEVANILSNLQKMITEGKWLKGEKDKYTVNFHPDVIENLRSIYNEVS